MNTKTNSLIIAIALTASAALTGIAEARGNGGGANGGPGGNGPGDNGPEISRAAPAPVAVKRPTRRPLRYTPPVRECRDLVQVDATCPQGR